MRVFICSKVSIWGTQAEHTRRILSSCVKIWRMVICERWSISSSYLTDICRSSSMTARTVLMFTYVICEWGRPVGFVCLGTVLRSFTNIACHFNTVDLPKHSSPYASFNLERFWTLFYCDKRNILLQHFAQLQCQCFLPKKMERSTNSEIECQLQYAIKCTLRNVDCSSLARTTHMCLHYRLHGAQLVVRSLYPFRPLLHRGVAVCEGTEDCFHKNSCSWW